MKLNDVKHNHSLTDLLKVILFSLIMLLPFLDVGTRCAYVIANKNAYQSYSNVSTQNYVDVASNTTLVENAEYRTFVEYDKLNNTYMTNPLTIGFNEINLTDIETITGYNNINKIMFHPNGYVNLYNDNTQVVSYGKSSTQARYFLDKNIYFLMNVSNTNIGNNNYTLIKQLNITFNKLDNVFEYSVSQLENSQLYNWTMQTAIYSGVTEMTAQLGITGNFIPIILCYWLFITIIYILIDIVIKLFTLLTHALGSKTA